MAVTSQVQLRVNALSTKKSMDTKTWKGMEWNKTLHNFAVLYAKFMILCWGHFHQSLASMNEYSIDSG